MKLNTTAFKTYEKSPKFVVTFLCEETYTCNNAGFRNSAILNAVNILTGTDIKKISPILNSSAQERSRHFRHAR